MSLKEEKELEHFKSLMYLEEQGTATDPGPYWVTKQPWKVSMETLVDNQPAVLRVMNSTKAKLNRKPDWRMYTRISSKISLTEASPERFLRKSFKIGSKREARHTT